MIQGITEQWEDLLSSDDDYDRIVEKVDEDIQAKRGREDRRRDGESTLLTVGILGSLLFSAHSPPLSRIPNRQVFVGTTPYLKHS
mmetsp:Transcript_12446/g.33304  ORF Transcript_12446/g.33304 Transcript_12446/m.33304 type:complete len:85 (-) Transcript_12446:518-772(-)